MAAVMASQQALQDQLLNEMVQRIPSVMSLPRGAKRLSLSPYL